MTLLLRSSIFALTVLVVSAVVTSSCGVSAFEAEAPAPDVLSVAEESEDSFCNCHLKAELEHVTAVGLPPVIPGNEIVTDATLAIVQAPAISLTLASGLYPPPDQVPIKPPEQSWPVRLARAHL